VSLLESPAACMAELERINKELAKMWQPWASAARDVIIYKSQIELERAKVTREKREELSSFSSVSERINEIDLIIEKENGLITKHAEAKANTDGYERMFKVYDVARSNVQSAIKIHERTS